MRFLAKNMILASALVSALACSGLAGAATILPADLVPEATFVYGTNGPGMWGQIEQQSGGTATITKDFPRSGNGSLKIDLPNGAPTSSKAGAGYYPTARTGAGFGPVSSITAVSYDVMLHSGATTSGPVLRLYLQNNAGLHIATLVYIPDVTLFGDYTISFAAST